MNGFSFPALPSLPSSIAFLELVGAILAIVLFGLSIVIFVLILWVASKSESPKRAVPKAISLSEQLQQDKPRYFCFVDLDEARRIYLQRHQELPSSSESVRGTTSSGGYRIGTATTGAERSSVQSASDTQRFDVPIDENLVVGVIRDLVGDGDVGFGIESGTPDKAKLEVLEECGRKLSVIGASLPDSFMSRHKTRLTSEGVPSKDEKCAQIRALCGDFTYLAMKGSFMVSADTSVVPAETPPTVLLSLNLPHGIVVSVRVPLMKVKEASRHLFVPGGRLDSLMVFGIHLGWNDQSSSLQILPLAIAASWTNN